MSVQLSTSPLQREINASYQQILPALKVHGKLDNDALLQAEKAHSFAPGLIFVLGTILFIGAPAIIVGLVIYNIISWLVDGDSHRRRPIPVYYPQTPVRHPVIITPEPRSDWFWNPFRTAPAFYPSSSHATVGGRRTGGPTYVAPPPAAPSSGWASWLPSSAPSYPSSSHATVGGRRTGGYGSSYTPPSYGGSSSTSHSPSGGFTSTSSGGGSHATVGGRKT